MGSMQRRAERSAIQYYLWYPARADKSRSATSSVDTTTLIPAQPRIITITSFLFLTRHIDAQLFGSYDIRVKAEGGEGDVSEGASAGVAVL
jgi:hypothetical protein